LKFQGTVRKQLQNGKNEGEKMADNVMFSSPQYLQVLIEIVLI
jgi:hypothetical protein